MRKEGVYIDDFIVESTCAASGGVQGNDYPLFDIWGSSTNNIFAVGSGGLVARYNGQTWSEIDFSDLVGLGFQGSVRIFRFSFAVGEAGLLARRVPQWTASGLVNLKSVWGNSESALYAVGESGTILYNGGSGW